MSDLIDRAEVIAAIDKMFSKSLAKDRALDAVNSVPSVEPTQVNASNTLKTLDCISRQAAIEEWKNDFKGYVNALNIPRDDYNGIMEYIDELPSEQPEPHWIPCSERLPEEPYGCLVTVWDTNPITMDEFENILPYFVGWDGEQWNDGDGEQCPFEVTAWMLLPEPWKGE